MRLTSSPLLFSFSPFLLISLFLLSACTPPPTNTPTPTPLLHLETATPLPPSPTPEPTFRIIGYVTDDVIPELVPYAQLTHINYAFVVPNADGTFHDINNPWKLKAIVEKSHAQGVKVLVSVGGWGWDEQFEVLAADPATRATFVSGLAAYAEEYNLDGLDIDWEYPDPGTSDQHFLALMQELRAALPEGKLLTAAVLAQGPTVEGILPETFPLMDFVNIMAYDASDTDHSPYAFAETAMNVWLARGLPPEKTVLGVPFYARPNWVPYRKLVESDSNAASLDVIEYLGQNVYYNGLATMEQKTQLALTKGSGIMIWTLGYDTNDETSLLSAIYNTVHKAP